MNWDTVITKYIKGTPGAMYNIGVGPKREAWSLKSHYPDMLVFGCEPAMLEYPVGTFTGFPGELRPIAISSKAGTTRVNLRAGRKSKTEAPTMTLDEYDRAAGHPDRILLWADIEGAELDMLISGPDVMESGRVKWINLEEHKPGHVPEGSCDPRELRRHLETLGYVRAESYHEHATHLDAIYVHKSEI